MRIVISQEVIIINQTQHIKHNILYNWFPINTSVKSITTSFDENKDFERIICTTKAIPEKDLQAFEKSYHG